MTHTFESILGMIYELDARDRSESSFTSDIITFMDLKMLHDGDGRFMVAAPMHIDEHPRLLGYNILVDKKYNGLSFGPP